MQAITENELASIITVAAGSFGFIGYHNLWTERRLFDFATGEVLTAYHGIRRYAVTRPVKALSYEQQADRA